MLSNRNNSNTSRRTTRRSRRRRPIPRSPAPLPSSIALPLVLRFQKSATTTASVYFASLAKLLVASISSTVGFCIYESVRVTDIYMWGPAVTLTSATGYLLPEIQIRLDDSWTGQVSSSQSAVGAERVVRSTATSSRGSVIHARHTGLLGVWFDAENINASYSATPRLYVIDGPLGSIIDLHLVVKINNSKTSAYSSLASTGAAANKLYYNFLDSVSNVGGTGTTILPCLNWSGGPSTTNWT